MQFKTPVTVLGCKAVDFKTEDGRHYDHVVLYAQMPLDHSPGNTLGDACEQFNWQDSKNFEKLKGYTFPLKLDMTIEMLSNGKTTKMVCLDVHLPKQV